MKKETELKTIENTYHYYEDFFPCWETETQRGEGCFRAEIRFGEFLVSLLYHHNGRIMRDDEAYTAIKTYPISYPDRIICYAALEYAQICRNGSEDENDDSDAFLFVRSLDRYWRERYLNGLRFMRSLVAIFGEFGEVSSEHQFKMINEAPYILSRLLKSIIEDGSRN